MEWQPIETAPKDGTLFLAMEYLMIFSQIMYVAKYSRGHWVVDWNHESADPTNWMPLPAPPA